MRPDPAADGLGGSPAGRAPRPAEDGPAVVPPDHPVRAKTPGPADDLWVWAARVLGSSSFRLAVLYMLLLMVSVAILLGFIYWSTAGYMDRQLDATIEAETQGLAEQYRRRGLRGLTSLIQERVARDPSRGRRLSAGGQEPPAPGRQPGPLARGFPDADGWVFFRLRERGPDRTEEHSAGAQVFRLQGDLRLLVGRDVRDLEATRRLILEALTWGLAHSRFCTCSRICSIRTFISTASRVTSTSADLEPRVLASRLSSCIRKSRRRPHRLARRSTERTSATWA
jgi:hypothetical protein